MAGRLTELLRPGDTLARLAGDEFIVLCEDLEHTSQVEPVATRIDEALGRPFVLSGIEVQVSASVGIAFAGRGDDVPEHILQDADTAMYQAKRRGGARHGMVDVGEQRLAENRAALNRDLRGALARRELRTEYQPIVATADGRITGVEALLRWAHPCAESWLPTRSSRSPSSRASSSTSGAGCSCRPVSTCTGGNATTTTRTSRCASTSRPPN